MANFGKLMLLALAPSLFVVVLLIITESHVNSAYIVNAKRHKPSENRLTFKSAPWSSAKANQSFHWFTYLRLSWPFFLHQRNSLLHVRERKANSRIRSKQAHYSARTRYEKRASYLLFQRRAPSMACSRNISFRMIITVTRLSYRFQDDTQLCVSLVPQHMT